MKHPTNKKTYREVPSPPQQWIWTVQNLENSDSSAHPHPPPYKSPNHSSSQPPPSWSLFFTRSLNLSLNSASSRSSNTTTRTLSTTISSAVSIRPHSLLPRSYYGGVKTVTVSSLIVGKKTILFAVPWSFTPTCLTRPWIRFQSRRAQIQIKEGEKQRYVKHEMMNYTDTNSTIYSRKFTDLKKKILLNEKR